jgi:hypothetical protein
MKTYTNLCELLVHNSQTMYRNEIFPGQKLWRQVIYTVSFQCTFPLSLEVVEMLASNPVTLLKLRYAYVFLICVFDVKITEDPYYWQYLAFIFRPLNPKVSADR